VADLGSLLGGVGGGAIGQAIVRLELDTSKYTAEMKAAQAQTTSSANTMGSGFSKFGGLAQTAMLGAGVAVAAFAASSVKAFVESEKVMAQTEAVLKSTGGAANVTKEQVLGLADRLRDLSGADNDAIQASENLLLTFRDIRNEAGQGNDIFNQTERAILDMATAMNSGAVPSMEALHNTTIQVGKALNDPIQGMTALRRVGVSFTESQVKMITSLQESGDLMGAQKIVLQELQKEFGGAAEAAGDTFAGQLGLLSSKFGDVQEQVGEAIIPLLIEFLHWTLEIVEALGPLLELIAKAGPVFRVFGEIMLAVLFPLEKFIDLMQRGVQPTDEMVDLIGDVVRENGLLAQSAIDGADALDQQRAATDAVVESMREQLDATLALADSTFGLINAARENRTAEHELAVAHHRVNELQREGKEGTKAYAEARRDLRDKSLAAAESELGLAAAARKLQEDVASGKTSRQEAVDAIRDLGREAGLTKKDIQGLVDEIKGGLHDAAATAERLAPGIGHSISEGIASGIDDLAPAVAQSAEQAVLRAIAAARVAARAYSPSEKMIELGADLARGLEQGILKNTQKAVDAAKEMLQKVIGAASAFRSGISSGISSFGDLGGAFGTGELPLGEVIATQIGGATQLAAILNALKAQGASKGLLSQVASSGAGFGQALLQGGPAQIEEANAALKTIADLAQQTGKGLSEAFFGDRIDKLKDKLENTNEELREIQKAIRGLEHGHDIILDGEKIAITVRKELISTGGRNPNIFGGRA
jgi:hypothetical protein